MARWDGDLLDALWRTAAGDLDGARIGFQRGSSCCVVVCAQGYPAAPRTGDAIEGIGLAEAGAAGARRVVCFQAGTRAAEGGGVVTAGGRVLGVTATADDLRQARDAATEAARKIDFPGAFMRSDIGMRVLRAESPA
jgi:phosphoribosylamine--glycine ligase